jgi:hypothetical protein
MRVSGVVANEALTDQRRDLLGRLDVGLRQQVRIDAQHRLGAVAEAGGCDVHGDAVRERQRGVSVPQDVQRPGHEPRGLSVAQESLREP